MVNMGKDAYTQIIIYQYLRKDKEKDKYIAANKKGQLWLGKFNVFVFVLGLDFVFVFACMLINTDLSEGIIANIYCIYPKSFAFWGLYFLRRGGERPMPSSTLDPSLTRGLLSFRTF